MCWTEMADQARLFTLRVKFLLPMYLHAPTNHHEPEEATSDGSERRRRLCWSSRQMEEVDKIVAIMVGVMFVLVATIGEKETGR